MIYDELHHQIADVKSAVTTHGAFAARGMAFDAIFDAWCVYQERGERVFDWGWDSKELMEMLVEALGLSSEVPCEPQTS